ncbi:hypothetical protein GCM10028822_42750 [Hymenobacter terrigena]
METSYSPSPEELSAFWQHPDTLTHFGTLELTLRSGTHLQAAHPEQSTLVRYLRQHYTLLNYHFSTVYSWQLVKEGSLNEPYYFLAPLLGAGAQQPLKFRREFGPEYVIVALLLCKVSIIDYQITDFASADDLLQQLQDEYEPYREGLFWHLAHVKGDVEIAPDKKKVIGWLKRCFKEYKRLGWLYEHPDGRLEVMPALDRIREMYEVEIKTLATRYQTPSTSPAA